MSKLFLFFIGVLSFLAGFSQDQTPVYQGKELDLGNYKIARLFKGDNKVFVEGGLNGSAVYELVSQEKSTWTLLLDFQLPQESIIEKDIWLQFRSNLGAAEIYVNEHLLLENGKLGHSAKTEVIGKQSFLRDKKSPNTLLYLAPATIPFTAWWFS